MPLNLRASDKLQKFNVPVSYRIHDRSGKFLDARNVNSIQDRLDTRYGSSRHNTVALPGAPQSVSFFSKSDGSSYIVAKVGDTLYSVSESGAHTAIKTGLSALTVHRGDTINDRHIINIGSDGLFAWNGTIFSRLGQAKPSVPTVAVSSGGSLITTNAYQVAITFYASSIGFESNYSESAEVTATSPNLQIDVSNIPATADNLFVDKVLIYLKNVTADGEYLYVDEISLGTTTYTITEESLSAEMPPTKNALPPSSGKFTATFNRKLVVYGSDDFPGEGRFSEEDLPDAFNDGDDALIIPIPGKGRPTGLAVGLYSDSVLDPFLVFFKNKSTHVYSEIGDAPKFVTIDDKIGCVSHDTIQVKNGVVYFLSEEGWRAIKNGRFITNEQGEAVTLGAGDIDDIFKSTGYAYEVNRQGLARSFSVYYPTLDQYITWVSEGTNNAYTKAYVYEFDIGGFKPYEFALPATCACIAEDSDGRDVVLFGTAEGYLIKHSIMESRSDVDATGAAVAINAFAVLPWLPDDGDFDATYNFRELILKAIVSDEPVTVKTFVNYDLSTEDEGEYEFTDPSDGFILDESELDVDKFGDERAIKTSRSDINRVGETIAIGFYQNAVDANIALVAMQIDSSKNGNRNSSNDNFDEEGGFDSETQDYFPSVSAAVQEAQAILQQIQALYADFQASAGNTVFAGWSDRFDEAWDSNGIEDTFEKIIQLVYAAPLITLAGAGSGSLREKGTVVSSVLLTATTSKRSNDIGIVRFYRAGVLINTIDPATAAGAAETYTENTDFSDTLSFQAEVDDVLSGGNGPTTVQSNIVTYTFVYPYYYGAGAVGLTAAQVAALTKDVISSDSNVNYGFTSSNGDVYYMAYPASYGPLTSILDENGFETFADWTLRTENITGLDGSPVSYRIYEFNNPVVAGSTDYTFIR